MPLNCSRLKHDNTGYNFSAKEVLSGMRLPVGNPVQMPESGTFYKILLISDQFHLPLQEDPPSLPKHRYCKSLCLRLLPVLRNPSLPPSWSPGFRWKDLPHPNTSWHLIPLQKQPKSIYPKFPVVLWQMLETVLKGIPSKLMS